MYAIRPATVEEWRASSPPRPETEAALSPLTAIGVIAVLVSLWFGTVMVLDRTGNLLETVTTLGMAGP